MRIRIEEIDEAGKDFAYEEPFGELNLLLQRGPVQDYEFDTPVAVRVAVYRAGADLVCTGSAGGGATAHCARCLEEFSLPLDVPFSVVLAPRSEGQGPAPREDEDGDYSYYEGDHVELSPLIREAILLALPMRPVCDEDCRGLCPSCGANLNTEACGCRRDTGDPRLAVLRSLKVHGS